MPFTLTMPKLSPTMEGGKIVSWHQKEGDHVKEGDLLFEVATDKATVEYNALDEGYLRRILVQAGDAAIVNQPVAIFTAESEESIEGYTPEGTTPKAPEKKPQEAKAPDAPEALAPSKPAPSSSMPAFEPAPPLEKIEDFSKTQEVIASPLARKMALEQGLDLSTVKGSGPGHRIVSKDLERAQPNTIVTFGRQERPKYPSGTYTEEELTPMRQAVGDRLQASKATIPHFYVQQSISALPLIELREQLKAIGLKVTFNDFMIKAAALALREHPAVNSGFNSKKGKIIRFLTVDISVAVSVEGGLITPIIRYADYKDVGHISKEVKQLVKVAKQGKLTPQQYQGGSFTISNLGMFGISHFQAVINPPQAAILAIGGMQESVSIKEGNISTGKTMVLSLASDHRVIDGSDAAQYLKTLKLLLENPSALLISS